MSHVSVKSARRTRADVVIAMNALPLPDTLKQLNSLSSPSILRMSPLARDIKSDEI